jgi:hypothetical protein
VFIRNLKFNFADLHKNQSTYSQQISASGGFGFGLFRLGGGYRRGVAERKFTSRITENGLEVPGMQLIAFRCAVLPKSPSPSEAIKEWA